MKLPAGIPARVLKRMQPRPRWNAVLMHVAMYVGVGMVLWGESALPGGRPLSFLGLIIFIISVIHYPFERSGQRWCARRYRLPLPSASPYPLRQAILFSLATVLSFVGLSRHLLIEAKYAPFHAKFDAIYTKRPSVEFERLNEWIGPWHARRSGGRHYSGFGVQLGQQFVLIYTDLPDGSTRLDVEFDDRWWN